MNLRQIQDIAGHRNLPPWVIKLVQDCIEHDRTWERPSRAAMQMALKALESKYIVNCGAWRVQQDDAVTALREALAQLQEPSPAFQIAQLHDVIKNLKDDIEFLEWKAAQPQDHSEQHLNMVQGEWVDLTRDEITAAYWSESPDTSVHHAPLKGMYAIIAKFKEKNTPPFAPNLNCKSVQRRLAISWGYVRKEEYDMAIEATKEKAAKVCENVICYHKGVAKLCAAAIRSMK